MIKQLSLETPGQGLHDITIQENADPTEQRRRGSRRELVVHVAA